MLFRSLPLWLLLAIVPDVWAVSLRPLLVDRPVQDTPVLTTESPLVYLDCSGEGTIAETEPCPATHRESPETDPAVVFVPARWQSTMEPRAGWQEVRIRLNRVRDAGALPVLILDGVPPELAEEPDPAAHWGRDDPGLPSTWPDAYAQFAREAVRELGPTATHFQIGSIANGARDGFPFPVHPVRYGQMVGTAAAAMHSERNDLCLLSAPLRPPSSAAVFDRSDWIRRFRQSRGIEAIGGLQLAPAAVRFADAESELVVLLSAAVSSPDASRRPAMSLTIVRPSPAVPGTGELYGYRLGSAAADSAPRHCLFDRFGIGFRETALPPQRTTPLLGLIWLMAATLAVRGLGPATKSVHALLAGRPDSGTHRTRDVAVLAMLTTVLILAMASRNWLWTSCGLALLCALAFVWPVHNWWLMLATLPFQQVHADSGSLLGTSLISLGPAHLLLLGLIPRTLAEMAKAKPWRLAGWRTASAAHWFAAVWSGLAVYGLVHSPDTSGAQAALLLDWLPLGVLAATLQQARGQRAWQGGTVALVVGTCLFSVQGLGEWLIEVHQTTGAVRLSGLTFSPNHAAMIAGRGLWVAAALYGLAKANPVRAVSAAVVALHAAALFATISRGALLLGLPAGLLWTLFGHRRRQAPGLNADSPPNGQSKTTLVAASALAVGLLFFGWGTNFGPLWDRMTDAEPIQARVAIWQYGASLIPASSSLGPGPDRFAMHMDRAPFHPGISPDLRHPHNGLLESLLRWGSWGLLPALLLLPLLWTGLRHRHRGTRGRIGAGLAAALAAGLAHSLVDTFWMLPDVAAMNLALAGLLWKRSGTDQAGPGSDKPRTRAWYSMRGGSAGLPATKFRPTATTRRPEAKYRRP